MASVLILAAAGAAVAALLALRLWVVLHSRVLVPRQSLSLLVVAGSGKYWGGDCRAWVGDYKPQSTPRHSPLVFLALFGALHAEICSFPVLTGTGQRSQGKILVC